MGACPSSAGWRGWWGGSVPSSTVKRWGSYHCRGGVGDGGEVLSLQGGEGG